VSPSPNDLDRSYLRMMMMTLIDTRTARDEAGELEAPAGSAGRRCECGGGGGSRNDQKPPHR
jgi:hypothetical protein